MQLLNHGYSYYGMGHINSVGKVTKFWVEGKRIRKLDPLHRRPKFKLTLDEVLALQLIPEEAHHAFIQSCEASNEYSS